MATNNLTRPLQDDMSCLPAEPVPSFEEMLLQNVIQLGSAEGAVMDWNSGKDWIARHSSWLWAVLFLMVGAYLVHRWPVLGFPHAFGEFLLLAGGLTITVDPYLKRKLQREAAEDIFHHLLGFDLPLEIRETLRDFLLHNRHYRENANIDVTVTPTLIAFAAG